MNLTPLIFVGVDDPWKITAIVNGISTALLLKCCLTRLPQSPIADACTAVKLRISHTETPCHGYDNSGSIPFCVKCIIIIPIA